MQRWSQGLAWARSGAFGFPKVLPLLCLFLLVSGLESPATESRITALLKVICCVLRAPVGVCVSADGLMETGKGRKSRKGVAFLQDPYGDAQQHVMLVAGTRRCWGLGSPRSAWHAAPRLVSGSLATVARSSAGKL